MSLVQFVQQTLLKDVSFEVLESIQNAHSAAESLLEGLSSLREESKSTIIDSKLKEVRLYLELREDMFKCLSGMESDRVASWIMKSFAENPFVCELAKMERNRMESIVLGSVREVFLDGQQGLLEEEGAQMKEYLRKLQSLKELQSSNSKPNRQQMAQIGKLDESYLAYARQFELKKQKFNKIIEARVQLLRDYGEKVKREFAQMLDFGKSQPKSEAPFKANKFRKEALSNSENYDEGFFKFEQYPSATVTSFSSSGQKNYYSPYVTM